jgi:hypothetical protein
MARNLSRNTKLYLSTLPPASIGTALCVGDQTTTNLGDNNTWEVKVLDGYSFSQDTSQQEIGVSESASECVGAGGLARGTLTFNTALNPVDVSFSVYARPYNITAFGEPNCVELPLWCAALGTEAAMNLSPDTPANGATFDDDVTDPEFIKFTTEQSDQNELMLLYLYFVLESTTYVVNEFTVGTIEADFSIDGIATLNISGSGTSIQENPSDVHAEFYGTNGTDGNLVSGTDYVAVPTTSSSSFLRNKLGTLELTDLSGVATSGDTSGNFSAIALGVITTDADLSAFTGDDTLVGGRVYAETDTEWAQIIAHTTTGTNDTITVSGADATMVNGWNATQAFEAFKPGSASAVSYCIPITAGTLTLENNMSYLTPEELAIVNQPLAGFTGNRSISGSVTAYLNTGAMGSGGLLQDLLNRVSEVTNNFQVKLHMGNDASSTPRVDFEIPHAQIGIPTTNVEDVISTEITFNAKSWDDTAGVQSFEGANEMTVAYVTAGS